MASPQPVPSSKTSDRDLTSIAEARTLARRAKQAQAEIAATAARLARQYPATNRGWTVNTMPLAASVGMSRRLLTTRIAVTTALRVATGRSTFHPKRISWS